MNSSQRSRGWHLVRGLLAVTVLAALGGVLACVRYRQDMAAAEDRIAAGSKLAETPCGVIEYGERGTGQPVLALHGAGGGYDQGLLTTEAFGTGFRTIAPSRFGYLNSPVPTDGSVFAQADAYACLLDYLGVDRVSVVAGSAGGPSALAFALRHPDRVDALVLVSAISTLRPIRDDSSGPSPAMLSDFVYWAAATYWPGAFLNVVGLTWEAQQQISSAEYDRMTAVVHAMMPMSRRIPGMNLDAVEQSQPEVEAMPLADIRVPTLVLHAVDDALIPIAQGQHSAQNIPDARWIPFERGGHFMFVLDSAVAEMRAFISEHGGPA